jgi:cobalamin biosynthesis protein CobD/CbiB
MTTLAEPKMSFVPYAMMVAQRCVIWSFAIGMILICLMIFLAMYGIYLLLNEILYVTNLLIFGLNMIVAPFAMAIKAMIDGINAAIKAIQDIFDSLNPANWF